MNDEKKEDYIITCQDILTRSQINCLGISCLRCPALAYRSCTAKMGIDSDVNIIAWFETKLAELKGENMETKYDLNTVAGKEQAMRDGYKLQFKYGIGYYDNSNEDYGPFIYLAITGDKTVLYKAWREPCTLIPKEKPKTYMTRYEVLGFLANTPGIVMKLKTHDRWYLPGEMDILFDTFMYEHTTIDLDGNYGEPMEFVK